MNDLSSLHDLVRRSGSQRKAAAILGVNQSSLSRWISTGRIPADTIAEIEKALASPAHADSMPDRHDLAGVSTLRNAQGKIVAQWTKTARPRESAAETLVRLAEDLPLRVTARTGSIKAPRACESDLLAVYPLGDPHVGMLAWAPESGEDFDLAICENLLTSAMADLVLRGPRAKRALIVNLGDFFHADNGRNHTTKGDHTLDVDGRRAKVLAIGLRILITLIDTALAHHEIVTVDNRIGNHDGDTSIALALTLGAYYRNEPRVQIPATIAHRSYYTHGANLIGVTHGDRAKMDALGEIMAAERPKEWGASIHRVWYTGHVHHQIVKEFAGVRVESFRTLAARDSWHAAQGYVAGRDMHRITLHAEHGEISREIVNVNALLRGQP